MMQIRLKIKAKMTKASRGFASLVMLLSMLSLLMTSLPRGAHAQARPTLIRDTEIEEIFKQWMQPLLVQAHIPQDGVNIVLVQSTDINAFVAGGANIFFYTGLIEKTDSPQEIMGVLAHELGHIAGGHLIKSRAAMERASYESILGMVLGLGAALATGEGEAAGAVIMGSQSMAAGRYLAHSRIQESSADQAAFSYLEGAGFTADGLPSFFEKLQSEELLPASRQSQYMRTHPVTRDRIDAIKTLIDEHPEYKDKSLPAEWIEQHARMKAKLVGFINPGSVAWEYDDSDQSIAAQYARAIAFYRQNDIDKAISGIDALIAREPHNPYFYELKGQMLSEYSQIEKALAPYKKAVFLKPDAPLIRIAYAHSLIESGNDQKRLKEAVENLNIALAKEAKSSRAHRLLATAYGRLGDEIQAKLHLAEEAVLTRRLPYARMQAAHVLQASEQGSKTWLRAKDILTHVENLERAQRS